MTAPSEKEIKMNDEKEMKDFYAEIVESLKKEATGLKNKLTKCSENNEANMYVQLIKALRDTLDLIEKYDKYSWKAMFSEYVAVTLGKNKKMVSVWEQNGSNVIRNKKSWTVFENETIDEKEGK